MNRSIEITPDEQALINASMLFASRMAEEKLTTLEWAEAQLALNDASMSLQHGAINPAHIALICGCLEGVRRHTANDRLLQPSQRLAVMMLCDLTTSKLQQAIT